MRPVPETTTISYLRKNQTEVLSMVAEAPVMLLQNSKPVAIMVDPVEWNKIANELKECRERFKEEELA